jgi:DNA-binding response OmpR family regulator
MRVLVAEDDPVSRRVIEATLQRAGYEAEVVGDGAEAMARIETVAPPRLLVLDWMMPEIEGPELCRRLRARDDGDRFYAILLTAKVQKEDIVTGLRAGADDYLTKPFHHAELLARLASGRRILELQERLDERIHELQEALEEVDRLSGLLPICAYCKRVREGDDYWQAVEEYVAHRTAAQFSHAVCPECYDRVVRPQIEALPQE